MSWPLPSHFAAMLQVPRAAFRDTELKACQIERNAENQPRPRAGQFAVVYKAMWSDGRPPKAVRVFSSGSPERRERYALLSEYVMERRLRCLVPFEYRDNAIRSSSDGAWYPLIVMDWVEGGTLLAYARSRCLAGKAESLAKAARKWVGLVQELAEARIAHGDLQHANVMVTPAGLLRLVDYDGMCVPALVGRRNLELGVAPYQHPQRSPETLLNVNLDRFSAIVIYVALRALAAEPGLWQRHVESLSYDKLLFRSEDLRDSHASALHRDLRRSPDPQVPRLAAMLVEAAAAPVEQVPSLDDVIQATRHQRLSRAGTTDAVPTGGRASVTLAVVSGPLAGQQFVIDRHDTFIFGRHRDCHARLTGDPRVSRHHFILEVNPPVACIRDLGSRNGTRVNGVKHGGRVEEQPTGNYRFPQVDLCDGDTVVVGRTRIRVRIRAGPRVERKTPPKGQEIGGALDFVGPHPTPKASRGLADYQLGPAIGRGPIGTAYRAVRRSDGAEVVVKIAELKIAADAQERRQFMAQVEKLCALRHPNIVSLLACGTRGRDFYFVSEFCPGGNLGDRMQDSGGLLCLAEAAEIFAQCLDALDHAHRQGFIHGNLNLENVLFGQCGGRQVVQVADFGLTALFERAGLAGLTATSKAQLEYQFMPREQLTGYRDSYPVSDLWRLAAVFYYSVTRRPPRDLRNRDPIAVVLNDECVPLASRDPRIPRPITAVIDRALRNEPQARYPSAAMMKAALLQGYAQAGKPL